MQRFGAASAKPTWLYSPFPWLSDIESFPAPATFKSKVEISKKYKDKDGKTRWSGGKDQKQSQHYSMGFGRAMQKVLALHKADVTTWALQKTMK